MEKPKGYTFSCIRFKAYKVFSWIVLFPLALPFIVLYAAFLFTAATFELIGNLIGHIVAGVARLDIAITNKLVSKHNRRFAKYIAYKKPKILANKKPKILAKKSDLD